MGALSTRARAACIVLAYKLGLFPCSVTFTPPGLTLGRPVPPFVQRTQTYDILNMLDQAPWPP